MQDSTITAQDLERIYDLASAWARASFSSGLRGTDEARELESDAHQVLMDAVSELADRHGVWVMFLPANRQAVQS
jgi:hypothetical protein